MKNIVLSNEYPVVISKFIERSKEIEVDGVIYAHRSISGSATTTGAFGDGYFDGNVGIGDKNPDVPLSFGAPH